MFKFLNCFRRPEKRYDNKGNLIYHDDRHGHITQYEFNDNGELIKRIYNGFCELYKEFDENNKLTYANHNGCKEWYTYNNSGKLIKYSASDGTVENYFYYKKGILIQRFKDGTHIWQFIGKDSDIINDAIDEYINCVPSALIDILGESL